MANLHFGWLAPVIGVAKSHYVPIVMAQEAEILPVVATHFDSLWVYDHFYGFAEHSDPWLEGWTTLTWLAARFPTVQIGTLVLGVGYRNPALVAKMAATLQVLSGGRLVLGLGAGWREEEYRAYGYPFPRAADRIRQVEEAVQIMRRMWTDPSPTFKGEYFVIEQASCPPLPTPPPPIMIGGEGEQLMLPLIARQADWWNVHLWSMEEVASYVPTYQRKRDLVYRLASAAGRDPATIVQTLAINGPRLPRSSDDSARWLDLLRPLITLGVTHVILEGRTTSLEPIERFAEEVITPLKKVSMGTLESEPHS